MFVTQVFKSVLKSPASVFHRSRRPGRRGVEPQRSPRGASGEKTSATEVQMFGPCFSQWKETSNDHRERTVSRTESPPEDCSKLLSVALTSCDLFAPWPPASPSPSTPPLTGHITRPCHSPCPPLALDLTHFTQSNRCYHPPPHHPPPHPHPRGLGR